MGEIPVGIRVIQIVSERCCHHHRINNNFWYKVSIFVLTFIAYTCYHASRKPLSIVKTYFNRSCENETLPPDIIVNATNNLTWCKWAPFYGPEATHILSYLDFAFLFSYAVAMFFSGIIAERVSLRYFLAVGMITSGISCYLLGIAHNCDIHSVSYFILLQIFGGIVQTSGWPGVVTVMGNWFGKKKRGFIFGLWNTHTSFGNILGGLIASYFVEIDWGLSFIIPGLMIGVAGFLNFLFLVDSPADVGCTLPEISDQPCNTIKEQDDSADSDTELLVNQSPQPKQYARIREIKAIGFFGALKIPGVIEFSLCLFFCKLVSYTFLYWLPVYIQDSTGSSPKSSSYVSTVFDIGGCLGGIVAGYVTDTIGLNATTCTIMLFLSVPLLWGYYLCATLNSIWNVVMMIVLGFFVNGPYALITTAVATELGTHTSLSDNSKALATVCAIIDGTGSIGAAVGPLLAGFILSSNEWQNVFQLLMISELIAVMMLIRLVKNEWHSNQTEETVNDNR